MLNSFHCFARSVFNADHRRIGGITFIKIGRFTFSFCVSQSYRPIKARA